MNKSQKAYMMGKTDYTKGVDRNPFNYMPTSAVDLAGWWQKGYDEAKRADIRRGNAKHRTA